MGVLGLSTFVHQHSDQFLLYQRVSSQLVLIDGDNLMYQLTARTRRLHVALGGEYLRLERSIRFFFEQLKKCDITNIVFFDGGTDPCGRKTKTQHRRLADKADTARHISISNQHRFNLLPHLAKIVFIETLVSMGVQYVVCDCEADEHLAALATRLNCAVLSDDSDFFAFAVRCILLSSLATEASYDENNGWFMDAVGFCSDKFISRHGLSRSVLPLLYCLQGNDYFPPSLLARFYHHHVTRLPCGQRRGSQSQRRVRGLLLWLRRFTCPYTALNQVLQHVRVEDRVVVRRVVLQCLHNYTRLPDQLVSCLKLDLLPDAAPIVSLEQQSSKGVSSTSDHGAHQNHVTSVSVDPPSSNVDSTDNTDFCTRPEMENLVDGVARFHLTEFSAEPGSINGDRLKVEDDVEGVVDVRDHNDQSEDLRDHNDQSEDLRDHNDQSEDLPDEVDNCPDSSVTWHSPVKPLNERLPHHLLTTVRTGAVNSSVINLINGQPVIFDPQVEDFTAASPAMAVLPLLSAQYAILQHLLQRPLPSASALLRDAPRNRRQQRHSSIARVPLPSLSPASVSMLARTAGSLTCECPPAAPCDSLPAVLAVMGVAVDADFKEDERTGVVLLWTGALTFWFDICKSMTSTSSVSQLTALIWSAGVLDSGWLIADGSSSLASAKCCRRMNQWRAEVWRMCGSWLNSQCSDGGGMKRNLVSTLHRLSAYQLTLSQVRNIAALLQVPPGARLPAMTRLYSGVLAAAAAGTTADRHSCCCRHGAVRSCWLPPCRPLAATLLTIRRCVLSMAGVTGTRDCEKCSSCDDGVVGEERGWLRDDGVIGEERGALRDDGVVGEERVGLRDDGGDYSQCSGEEYDDDDQGDDDGVCHQPIVTAETLASLTRI